MSILKYEDFLNEGKKTDTIAVFDIDDTLATIPSKIKYKEPDGEWKSVSTAKFADIRETLPKGTEYDFADFREYDRIISGFKNADPNIQVLVKYLDDAVKKGYKIGILTARGNQQAIWDGINKFLLYRDEKGELQPLPKAQFNKQYVFAISDEDTKKHMKSGGDASNPQLLKAYVLQTIFADKMGFNKVLFYDDDRDNIKAVKELKDLRISAIQV